MSEKEDPFAKRLCNILMSDIAEAKQGVSRMVYVHEEILNAQAIAKAVFPLEATAEHILEIYGWLQEAREHGGAG
jgi:hypothetical protein